MPKGAPFWVRVHLVSQEGPFSVNSFVEYKSRSSNQWILAKAAVGKLSGARLVRNVCVCIFVSQEHEEHQVFGSPLICTHIRRAIEADSARFSLCVCFEGSLFRLVQKETGGKPPCCRIPNFSTFQHVSVDLKNGPVEHCKTELACLALAPF